MIEVDEARQKIVESANTINTTEMIDINNCLGRVLAEDVLSSIDVPPADNSAMDGFVLNHDDVKTVPCTLKISQRIPAGASPAPLASHTAARIFTGAEIPKNGDAVVIQENCDYTTEEVTINKQPEPRNNIRPQGQDIQSGERVLSKGQKLLPQHIGLLAAIGKQQVPVFKRLRVSILSTGDELAEPGQALKPGQIYNSNQVMIETFLRALHCDVTVYPTTEDTLDGSISAFKKAAADSDLIISSGGVSVGEEDHIKDAVEALGKLSLWKINLKPGKPLAFGHIENSKFLGLPGNPVSAFVTFLLFGIPLIKQLQGQTYAPQKFFMLPIDFSIDTPRQRPEYVRVKIDNNTVSRFPNQSSGVLSSICWADALALIPSQQTLAQGDLVKVFPLESLQN
ncbi:MAG: molybdopterin molybdotransferase MoeA [Agarilytica sp.]